MRRRFGPIRDETRSGRDFSSESAPPLSGALVSRRIDEFLVTAGARIRVDDAQREVMTAVDPKVYETLRWGKQIAGLHVQLPAAKGADVKTLLRSAWERKAPKKLARPSAE